MGEHLRQFASREEEARFWQETGLTDLSPDEHEPVEVQRPDRPRSTTFALRLDPRTVELLRHVARGQGLGVTQLVRRWVLERLRIERTAGSLAELTGQVPTELELSIRQRAIEALFESLPEAIESALQEVLDRADQETHTLRETF